VLKGFVPVKAADVKAAERAIIVNRFGGSAAAYRSALARAGASRSTALGVIADELRQARIARRIRVDSPSGAEIAEYQSTYSNAQARMVSVTPAPSWLAKRGQGVAIEGLAPASVFRISGGRTVTLKTHEGVFHVRAKGPTAPLGAFSLSAARASIRAALVRIAQDQSFDNWLMHREQGALSRATCRRDWLPSIGTLELTSELPFLALAS
jgi:hypothetical protein